MTLPARFTASFYWLSVVAMFSHLIVMLALITESTRLYARLARLQFTADLIPAFLRSDTWIHGAFALEQGFIFSAMILAAMSVELLERRFRRASFWSAVAAVLSACGLMHAYRWTPGDTVFALRPAWAWAAGYAVVAVLFFIAPWVTVEAEGIGH